jgi:HlyD family secretion protein
MKPGEEWRGGDDDDRWERSDLKERAADGDPEGPVGPQGAALILELQRIQRAFDQEQHPRGPHVGRHDRERSGKSNERHRAAKPNKRSKKRKGMMSRAVDACLESIGFGNTLPRDRTMPARDVRPPTSDRPARMERAGGHRVPPSQARGAWPAAATRPPRPEQAGDDGAAPTHAREARPPVAKRPRPEQADDHDMLPQQRPAPPRTTAVAKGPPTIALLESLAHDVDRQLARREPQVVEGAKAMPQGVAPAALKASVGRALETAFGHARSGYGFLVNQGGAALADDASGVALATRVGRSFERELRTGLRVLILGLGVAGGWATLVPLSGAVVVPGSLVVQSDVKKLQHPTGGVVAQIAVHDGMHVKAGDLVARLDETQVRANLQVITKQLDEAKVRIARLVAERDGLDEPKMPADMLERSGTDDDINTRFASERSLFKARATTRQSQKELLQSRIAQLGEQIGGLNAQTKSNASQLELIAGELEGVQTLFDKRLAPITRLNSLQRDSARLEGERGQLQSTIAETKSKIGEAQLQMLRVDQDFRADVIKDLREAEGKEAELAERRVAAQDQLNRIDIRAPTSGIVHQLALHTVGGVISAGQIVMEVVPDSDELLVEAHLPPNDIDQVKVGQATLVHFSALNRTAPQLSGVVSYVSADLSHEPQGNTPYYTVRVTLPEEERRRIDGQQLISGMPAEIFVQTGSRTMMSYLLKPIREQLGRAFNER